MFKYSKVVGFSFLLLLATGFAMQARAQMVRFYPGSRVLYMPDGAKATVLTVDGYGDACLTFERPRSDGAYNRCGVSITLLASMDSNIPGYPAPGTPAVYNPDASRATVLAIGYDGSVCLRFQLPRSDGAYVRCGIDLSLVSVVGRPHCSDVFSPGARVVYTPDATYATVIAVNQNGTACLRFDLPRSDGAYNRCDVSLSLIAPVGAPAHCPSTPVFGARVIYTPDASFATLVSIGADGLACLHFDYPRPDGAFDRCGIPLHLIRSISGHVMP